ncbi:MAG: sigma-70 family RNA polymerase sigma factor [Myxococcaceae bacterium]|nr:sigma-70 family RNA polymerase sigma factor [Myxococcaceae bacterium]
MSAANGLSPHELRDLYETFAPAVHRRAVAILGRDADAWDAVQEVFERMINSGSQFRGDAHPMTYIYRVTTNVCLNLLRARRLREPSTLDTGTADHGAAEASQFLVVLSKHLSERELHIATLYFIDELTQDEIADVLKLSRKTIGRELNEVRERALALAEPPGKKVSHG